MQLLIVEDENILASKYKVYLSSLYDHIDSTGGFYEAKEKIEEEEYDVILLDYNLPDGNGLELAKLLTQELPAAVNQPVVVLITGYSKETIAIRSLNLGVFRYLEKPVEKRTLVEIFSLAKAEAIKRNTYKELSLNFTISKPCEERLKNEYFVSPREMEIISKILIHGKNKPVAEDLGISAGTVRNHLSNLFQKLHVSNKEELREKIKNMNL
ncbi:MAG: response regulator transcription factor [Bdellovibrionota bacterium]|nr:response regulator transcription factor [Bdellovibrionota bacterium]